jgi:hypothetical protein
MSADVFKAQASGRLCYDCRGPLPGHGFFVNQPMAVKYKIIGAELMTALVVCDRQHGWAVEDDFFSLGAFLLLYAQPGAAYIFTAQT